MTNCNGESLNILVASTANAIAQNLSCDEIALLAALFNVLGDSLAVIAVTRKC